MQFVRLISARDPLFDEAFALYRLSFPEHERRPAKRQADIMDNPLYRFTVILESGVFVGILLYWKLSGCAYIEHFAISAQSRGHSLGTRSLSAFCESHPHVVLEIDPPVDEVSVRRERFYQRLGFVSNSYKHSHPAYRPGLVPHELVVMSYPQQLDKGGYERFRRELDGTVMQDAGP